MRRGQTRRRRWTGAKKTRSRHGYSPRKKVMTATRTRAPSDEAIARSATSGQVRGDAARRPMQVEGAPGDTPDHEDGEQHQQIGMQRRNLAPEQRAQHVEPRGIGDQPAHSDDERSPASMMCSIGFRMRLQHRQCSASRARRYRSTRSLKKGRSKASARRRRSFGSSGRRPPRGAPWRRCLLRLPRERDRWAARSRPAATVSVAPPWPDASTGLPAAMASSGVMPKSSSGRPAPDSPRPKPGDVVVARQPSISTVGPAMERPPSSGPVPDGAGTGVGSPHSTARSSRL